MIINDPATRLNATFASVTPQPGGLAIASQSGGVGIALLDLAQRRDSAYIPSSPWATRPMSRATTCSPPGSTTRTSQQQRSTWSPSETHSSSPGSPGASRNANRCSRSWADGPPVDDGQGPRTPPPLPPPRVSVDALFSQAGVVACDGPEDWPRPRCCSPGNPCRRVRDSPSSSNAGGLGSWQTTPPTGRPRCAGVLGTAGLADCRLGAGHCRARQPGGPRGGRDPAGLRCGHAARSWARTRSTRSLFSWSPPRSPTPARPLTALAEARTAHPDTPVLLVPMGGLAVPPEVTAAMATYSSTGAAIRALARAVRYATWLQRTPSAARPLAIPG